MTNNYTFNDDTYDDIMIKLSSDLNNRIKKLKRKFNYEDIIIVCIGSDKIVGDSYGPLVGSNLVDRELPPNVGVYGVIGNTINATNIHKFLCKYNSEINRKLVIAVDATVSSCDNFKSITISNEPIYPGKAIGKVLPKVGDISLMGIIANLYSCVSLNNTFRNVDKKDIIEMSNMTADVTTMALWQDYNENINRDKKYALFRN